MEYKSSQDRLDTYTEYISNIPRSRSGSVVNNMSVADGQTGEKYQWADIPAVGAGTSWTVSRREAWTVEEADECSSEVVALCADVEGTDSVGR